MALPDNKQIKDLFEGLLGRDVSVGDGLPVSPTAPLRPTLAVYVDDANRMSSVAVMDFELTAYCGAALALVPKFGADIAIEEKDLPDSLLENTGEILNVLSAPIGEASGVHQRLLQVYGPKEHAPQDVLEWAAQPGLRVDLALDIKAYGEGTLSVISTLV